MFRAALLLTLTGCAAARPTPPVRAAAAAAPSDGRALQFDAPMPITGEHDAVVRLVGPGSSCTGTLIAEDLVLTANHCVVQRDATGRLTSRPLDPRALTVELGGDYLPWGHVGIRAVLAPDCGSVGGAADVAVVVLSRALVGVPTATVRLYTEPVIGELLDPVGFGRCSTSPGVKRYLRRGGVVRSFTGETVQLEAAICPGDSGGPLLARGSGEVVGVISLSAMDGDEHTRAPSIGARIDAYRNLVAYARLVADGEAMPNELPPVSCESAGRVEP